MSRWLKRCRAVFLAVLLVLPCGAFQAFAAPGAIASTELPDVTQYATVEDLRQFNTNDEDGVAQSVKVQWGTDSAQNDLIWWVAGVENESSEDLSGNLVLMAADVLPESIIPFYAADQENMDWDQVPPQYYMDYINEDRANGTLWRNNWGVSTVRSFLAQYYLDTFTETQRSYMAVSEITTPDNRLADVDRKMVYYDLDDCYVTQDFLYLPAVEDASTHRVVVGERLSDEPKDYSTGLLVSASYLSGISVPNSWTRTPTYLRDSQDSGDDNSSFNTYAMSIKNDGYTRNEVSSSNSMSMAPAFAFDLSAAGNETTGELLFGSTVQSVADYGKPSGDIPLQDYMILRFADADGSMGTAAYNQDKTEISYTDVPAGVWLVVQTDNGAVTELLHSGAGTTSGTITAEDMGLESFANCRAWLEDYNLGEDQLVTASPVEEQYRVVNIVAAEGVEISSGNGLQYIKVDSNDRIDMITVTPIDGRVFSSSFANALRDKVEPLGLDVDLVDGKELLISGRPNDDVSVSLTLDPLPTPEVNPLAVTATTLKTSVVNTNEALDAEVEYCWNDGEWQQLGDETFITLEEAQPNTEYTLKVRFAVDGVHSEQEGVATATTMKDGVDVLERPGPYYPEWFRGMSVNQDITLPEGWTWEGRGVIDDNSNESFQAYFDVSAYEAEYDFTTETVGDAGWIYDKENHCVQTYVMVDTRHSPDVEMLLIGGRDILTDDDHMIVCGEGVVEYDPSTNSLSLRNATINSTDVSAIRLLGLGEGLTIKLYGTNTITTGVSGISNANNSMPITIQSVNGGSLSITSTGRSSYDKVDQGIRTGGALTLDGTTLTIDAEEGSINAGGGITVKPAAGANFELKVGSSPDEAQHYSDGDTQSPFSAESTISSDLSNYDYLATAQTAQSGQPGTCEHQLSHVDAQTPTCTDGGWEEYWVCDKCGKYFDSAEADNEVSWESLELPVDPDGHVASDSWVSLMDTHYLTCKLCGETLEEEPHDFTTEGAQEATCTEDGYTGDKTCTVCGRVEQGSVIPSQGHTYEHGVCTECGAPEPGHEACDHKLTHHDAVAATCSDEGNVEYWQCSECGKRFDSEEATNELAEDEITTPVDPDAHSVSDIWRADEDGHWHFCELCDKAFDEQAHDYVLEGAKEPACTEDGTETATCDNGCGETDTRTVAGSAKGHTFENGVCTACGAENPDYVPPEQAPADEDSADENPADKGDAIPATGDASLLLAAASVLLGGSTVAAGVFMRRKR